jgi:hypothetical protein
MGSLTGLGGATFLVPIYVLFIGMPIQYAAGANLISTIATSSGVVLLGSIYTQVARTRHELPDPNPPTDGPCGFSCAAGTTTMCSAERWNTAA